MRYIRTKDENNLIIDLEKTALPYIIIDRRIDFNSFGRFEIVEKANTIEELCDEFVVTGIFENQIGCCCDTFKAAKELKDYVELPQKQIIYGAIWTNKGLIYVAKMNEKGEFELL